MSNKRGNQRLQTLTSLITKVQHQSPTNGRPSFAVTERDWFRFSESVRLRIGSVLSCSAISAILNDARDFRMARFHLLHGFNRFSEYQYTIIAPRLWLTQLHSFPSIGSMYDIRMMTAWIWSALAGSGTTFERSKDGNGRRNLKQFCNKDLFPIFNLTQLCLSPLACHQNNGG
jgi:hypothetical protein